MPKNIVHQLSLMSEYHIYDYFKGNKNYINT